MALLPVVVDVAFVEPVGVFDGPDLLSDDEVVGLQLHAFSPEDEGLLHLSGVVQGQALVEEPDGFGVAAFRIGDVGVLGGVLLRRFSGGGPGRGYLPVIGLDDVKAGILQVANDAVFVDEDGVGDGLEAEDAAEEVVAVYDSGEGGAGVFDEGAGLVRALGVDGDGEDNDVFSAVLSEELLPDRQLTAASSPGGPHEDDHLPAPVGGEGDEVAVEGRQGEVRGEVADFGIAGSDGGHGCLLWWG